MPTLQPNTAADVETAVREALADDQPIEIVGHGSRRAIGHAMATNAVLDLSALSAIKSYEPQELLLTVEAGARVDEVEALLAEKNQEFAFEPINTARLLGTPDRLGTIGGMIASGLAGPRRIKAGGARDHLLGATASRASARASRPAARW
jgi:glycolate oxidase FAD binding subunit